MKKTACLSLLMLGFLMFLDCSCKQKAETVTGTSNDQITAQWNQVSDSIYAASKIPGMLIGIWAPDRNLVWIRGIGKANKSTAAKPDSSMKFRIGSITKTYTYTVLLMLVDEKQLDLGDKLSKFLPDFPKADSITIRMLCNHTSGIFDYTETQAFRVSLITNPLKKWTSQELIDLVKTEPFYFSPGKGFYYSNTNTIIAGKIIEQRTGNSVASEIQRRIFASLNFFHTIYPADHIMPANFIHGYGWSEEDTTDVSEAYDPSMAGCAGALVSDIYDLKAWVEFLYKGTLLSPARQAQRLTVVPAPGEDCEEYGLGIMHKISPPMWGHTGTIPGYKNWAGYCPSKNVTIVISYNATSCKPMVMATKLMNIYLGAVN
ncbi:MAG: serine hydrolase [Bacteroidetes bacterium]|nr:serine hydrolase [Bacteroidota bacterium]